MQRRQVVEDPERAAVGGDDHVRVLDDQVVDRGDRQIRAQGLPRAAGVEGHPHPRLGSRVEQPATAWVLADHPRDLAVRDAFGDARPAAAVVRRLEQIRAWVVELVACGRHVARGGVVGRRLQHADERPLGQLGRRHQLPGPPAITRQVHEPVVGAGPQHIALVQRLGEREDRAVDLGAAVVAADRTARETRAWSDRFA